MVGTAGPGAAQQAKELGIQAMATLSDPAVAVAGIYGALRTSGRTRISAAVGAGISDVELVGRGELLGHFLLSPEDRQKPGFYFAGGLAGVTGAVDRGYLVLTVGLEEGPRTPGGGFLEAGIGGGVRIAMGYRWRWFPVPKE